MSIRRMRALWLKPLLPLELWLGGGRPLSPYLVGVLVHYLRKKLMPRDITRPPVEYFQQPGMSDFSYDISSIPPCTYSTPKSRKITAAFRSSLIYDRPIKGIPDKF